MLFIINCLFFLWVFFCVVKKVLMKINYGNMFNDYIGLWVVNDGCIRIEKKFSFIIYVLIFIYIYSLVII